MGKEGQAEKPKPRVIGYGTDQIIYDRKPTISEVIERSKGIDLSPKARSVDPAEPVNSWRDVPVFEQTQRRGWSTSRFGVIED